MDPVTDLLIRLSRLLLGWSYEGSSRVEYALRRVAATYGRRLDAAVLADSIVLTVDDKTPAVIIRKPDIPGLDQAAELRTLVEDITRRSLPAPAAGERLAAIAAMPPRYPAWARLVGLALFSIGFSLSIQATWQELAAAAAGSVLVGAVVAASWAYPRLTLITPMLAAAAVSTLVLIVYQHGWLHGGPIQLMVPVLFFFIPGDVLSAAIIEIADGHLTAGATRVIYGTWLLLQLAFGAVIATVLARVPVSAIFDTTVTNTFPWWAVWVGWIGYTIGVMLVFSMRQRDLPWALLVVFITFGAAQLGTAAFGDLLGTFLGAVVMTLAVLLVARRPGRPASYVLFLGAFFVLTPGSRGLRGLDSWVGGHPIQGFRDFGDMIALLVAIGLGVFVTITVTPRRWHFDGVA